MLCARALSVARKKNTGTSHAMGEEGSGHEQIHDQSVSKHSFLKPNGCAGMPFGGAWSTENHPPPVYVPQRGDVLEILMVWPRQGESEGTGLSCGARGFL